MRISSFARWAMTIALFSTLLQGCSTVNISDYAGERPVLDLKSYFNGPVKAWGIVQNRSGKVIKRFTVDIDARWTGDTGTLDEHFVYADGTTQQRVWTVRKGANDRYVGTAADVVGEASGEATGNALRWRYVLEVPADGRTYHIDFDDWMFLVSEKVLINRTSMSKFGFGVGEITISFTKP